MHTTVKSLIYDYAGGIANGRQLKAVIPGGSSVPILLPDEIDVPASFDGLMKAGSLLGSAGMIVMDDTTCMVWVARTCCTSTVTKLRQVHAVPRGRRLAAKMLSKIERGEGRCVTSICC